MGCVDRPHFSLFLRPKCVTGDLFCSSLEGGHCFAEFETFEVSEAPIPVPH